MIFKGVGWIGTAGALSARRPIDSPRGQIIPRAHIGEMNDEELATERWENEGGRTDLRSIGRSDPKFDLRARSHGNHDSAASPSHRRSGAARPSAI